MKGIKVCFITIFLTLAYLIITVLLSNLAFYKNANGSLIKANNQIIGSKLIGQEFKNKIYFHPRPSFYNYKNDISGNSQLPYFSQELKKTISLNYQNFQAINPDGKPDLNLITESASGLDPDITYSGALSQIKRIASARNINPESIIKLVGNKSKPRIFGIFGDRIVNVLELNIELDNLYAKTSRAR